MPITLRGQPQEVKNRLTAFVSQYYNICTGEVLFDAEKMNTIVITPKLPIQYSQSFPFYIASVDPQTRYLHITHLFRENPRRLDCPNASLFLSCCLNLAMNGITELKGIMIKNVIEQDTSNYFKRISTKISISSLWHNGAERATYPHTSFDATLIRQEIDKIEFVSIPPLGKFTKKLIDSLSLKPIRHVFFETPKTSFTQLQGKLGGSAFAIAHCGTKANPQSPRPIFGVHTQAHRLNSSGANIHIMLKNS